MLQNTISATTTGKRRPIVNTPGSEFILPPSVVRNPASSPARAGHFRIVWIPWAVSHKRIGGHGKDRRSEQSVHGVSFFSLRSDNLFDRIASRIHAGCERSLEGIQLLVIRSFLALVLLLHLRATLR